jgi:hypothetical protein
MTIVEECRELSQRNRRARAYLDKKAKENTMISLYWALGLFVGGLTIAILICK